MLMLINCWINMNNYCLYCRYGDISSYLNELDESMTWMALNQQSLETVHLSVQCAPILVKIFPPVGSLHPKGLSEYFYCIVFYLSFITICRWMYALILAIDANFHLKLKVKGYAYDPALGDGWAYC